MLFIFLIAAGVLLLFFPTLRCAVTHPVKMIRYAASDLYLYIAHKERNICPTGELVAYTGLFG